MIIKWDDNKNSLNQKNHQISFDEAKERDIYEKF